MERREREKKDKEKSIVQLRCGLEVYRLFKPTVCRKVM